MGHHHHHQASNEKKSGKNLFIATILNLIITIAQIVGGILSNSLSLLSDALHNLSDSIALGIALWAQKVSRRPSTTNKTFGFQRIEILAAFVNSGVLVLVCGFLIYHAILRFYHPEPVQGRLMLIVATIGLLANLFSIVILKKDKEESLNIRAAYLHLLGDTLSSVAVIAGGFLIVKFNCFWIDPLVTIAVAVYIGFESIPILKDSSGILMQSVPENIDITEIKFELEKITGIKNIHHIHAWGMNESRLFLELHANLESNLLVSETEKIQKEIEETAHHQFGIEHITVQYEFECCLEKSEDCGCK
jgi:cobalt-zinc-cadmium efflux system protein